jgi:hypothetical protein
MSVQHKPVPEYSATSETYFQLRVGTSISTYETFAEAYSNIRLGYLVSISWSDGLDHTTWVLNSDLASWTRKVSFPLNYEEILSKYLTGQISKEEYTYLCSQSCILDVISDTEFRKLGSLLDCVKSVSEIELSPKREKKEIRIPNAPRKIR